VVSDCGFAAAYVTGAGIANTFLGIPDNGLVTVSELAQHVAAIREVFAGPLMVDADTGFGNALNMRRTVQMLERAGADAIQFEDQVMPKKCGHFNNKEVIGRSEMVGKIRAAVDARDDANLLVMARTDAAGVHGIEDAIERGHAFIEAGADILFIEATEKLADIERLPKLIDAPQLINIVIGGKTPVQSRDTLAGFGYALVLYANAALQGAVVGMQRALGQLRNDGRLDEDPAIVAPFAERQRLVNKPLFDQLDREYAAKD
jgi:2-methylisocitrate lyase-like PEP mutase family enzyme